MQFVELDFEHIKRGEFRDQVNQYLADMQRKFADHIYEHDVKAVAKMTVTISLECDPKNDADRVAIYTDINIKLPKNPRDRSATNALLQVDASSQLASLFTPEGGTASGNPRQGVLEENGRPIE